MIARALIHEPQVIFLDEPTVGLDPQARLALWEILRSLHAEGRTIVMTTHYMEEADQLCDRIAIVDRGRLLACDAPDELKRRAPAGRWSSWCSTGWRSRCWRRRRRCRACSGPRLKDRLLRAWHPRGGESVAPLIGVIQATGRHVRDIHLAEPSLETLFVSLTGRKLD